MQKKRLFTMTALFIAVMLVLGAGSASAQGNNFSKISNINQLNGVWRGTSSSSQTMKQFMESQGRAWTSELQQGYGNMNVKVELDLILSLIANTRSGAIIVKVTITFSGGNINSVWTVLRDALISDGSATANNSNHSVMYLYNLSEPITDSDLNDFQINQNGTRIRFSLTDLGISYLTNYLEMSKL